MQKAFRFIGLLAIFAFMVGCCAKSIPPLKIKRDIPINPESVLFIGASNAVSEETISGSAIIIEQGKEWSWAVSAGHVCYPEPHDNLVMWTEVWMTMAFNYHGEYEPVFMVALDQVNDICIFRVPMVDLPAVPVAKNMPDIGDKVFLGAYPLGIYNPGHVPFFEGYFAGILEGRASYTIPVAGGSSGGGIVNSDGELVGVVSLAIEGFENVTLAPKLENVQLLLDVAKKHPERFTIIR